MQNSIQREKVRFASGGSEVAAWRYPGTNGACVIMAGGSAVTGEPGTDRFTQRLQAEPARADRPGVIPMAPAVPGGERA